MKVKVACFLLFLGICRALPAQDLAYARGLVDTLGSGYMAGRAYVQQGDIKASLLIANEFDKHKLQYFGEDYFQDYRVSINTFPDRMLVEVNDKVLEPGRDFIVASSSKSIKGVFDLVWMADTNLTSIEIMTRINKLDLKNKFLVLENMAELNRQSLKNVRGVILLRDHRMVWSVSNGLQTRKMVSIEMQREHLPPGTKSIRLDIRNEYLKKYRTRNVIGYIEGSAVKDSFMVFTAHYDHLGKLGGRVYFPGANDNASGTAMILDLARHYSRPENKQRYSVAFMAFSGEEAGLLGSRYYVEHPLFPLDKIRFLVNLDMVGTGSDGIGVVNGTLLKKEMDKLTELNRLKAYMKEIKLRGESSHSDHHPFHAKGVPAIFIYTFGDNYKDYHNIYDRPEALPYTGYENLFRLLTSFIHAL